MLQPCTMSPRRQHPPLVQWALDLERLGGAGGDVDVPPPAAATCYLWRRQRREQAYQAASCWTHVTERAASARRCVIYTYSAVVGLNPHEDRLTLSDLGGRHTHTHRDRTGHGTRSLRAHARHIVNMVKDAPEHTQKVKLSYKQSAVIKRARPRLLRQGALSCGVCTPARAARGWRERRGRHAADARARH